MNQDVIDEANRAIMFIRDNGREDIASAIGFLSDSAVEAALDKISNVVQSEDYDEADSRIFVGGSTALQNQSGLNSDYTSDAIKLLKDEKKLVQIGRGRGQAFVLLTHQQFDGLSASDAEAEEVEEVVDTDDIDPSNVTVNTIIEYVNQLIDDGKHDLEEQLKQKEARIAELESQIEELRLTSWS